MNHHAAVLSALVDGEVVDPSALRAALDEPDAVQILLDFAALRGRLAGEDEVPQPRFYASWHSRFGSARLRAFVSRIAAAAVAIGVAMAGAFWMGSTYGGWTERQTVAGPAVLVSRSAQPLPPAPCAGAVAEPAAAGPSRAASKQQAFRRTGPGGPPRPARVIYLTNDLSLPSPGREERHP